MITRRVGEYAFVRPAREMLFSRVDTETKYKAKNLIDVPVYRGGDALTGAVDNALTWVGLVRQRDCAAGCSLRVAWAVNGFMLGRARRRTADAAVPARTGGGALDGAGQGVLHTTVAVGSSTLRDGQDSGVTGVTEQRITTNGGNAAQEDIKADFVKTTAAAGAALALGARSPQAESGPIEKARCAAQDSGAGRHGIHRTAPGELRGCARTPGHGVQSRPQAGRHSQVGRSSDG